MVYSLMNIQIFSLLFFLFSCSQATQYKPVASSAEPTKQNNAPSSTEADQTTNNQEDEKEKDETVETEPVIEPVVPIALKSSAFADNGAIPLIYAAAGQGGTNVSPPLSWGKAPPGTGSIAIQMVDLDSPQGGNPRVHWVITNIKADQIALPTNIPAGNNLTAPPEAIGANQIKVYGGPNPPNAHRYQWTVYAIKEGETIANLAIDNSAINKAELEGKAISMSVLTGVFTPN